VIVANLLAARLTILYGPSGVGKSSILRAAVVRDLRALPEAPLVVVHDSWSEDPTAALAHAIAAAAGLEVGSLLDTVDLATSLHDELYVVLDQLEEYFVYHGTDPALGEALAELTSRATLPVHVLLGIREDVLARLDAFKANVPGLLANRLRLDHLTREGGRRAILGPLERFGELVPGEQALSAEPQLVEAVLDGVRAGVLVQAGRGRGVAKEAPGQSRVEAPYLQVVLQRLWEEESAAGSRVLRLATLERLGGPGRIVENNLERALAALSPEQKQVAARMFNYLVTPSGTKIAHGTRDLADYASTSEAELQPVLAALGHERILRPVGGNGADAHEIYHDVLADAVLAWRGRFDAEQALEQERAAAKRRHRRLLAVVAASLVALAITAAFAVFAMSQRSEARDEARRAQARELDATALANLTVDPAQALEQALEAAKLSPSLQAEDVLRTTLLASRLRGVLPAGAAVTSAVYSPDGQEVLTASADGRARIFDARTHELRRTLDAGAPIQAAVFDRLGRLVVTAGADGAARAWSAETGRQLAVLRHGGPVRDVGFSKGGKLLVTASADRTARIWDATTWRPLATLRHPGPVLGAEFNPNGSLVVTRSTDRFARVFDTRRGLVVHTLDQGGEPAVAGFSPTGRYLLTAGANKTARIWVASTGRLVAELNGHRGPILGAAIAPSGGYVATASTDGSIRVWSFPDGELSTVLLGHSHYVNDVAYSPDGSSLVSTSVDRTARVWNPDAGDLRAVLVGHSDSVTSAAFNPEATAVVTASDDGTARIWDPQLEPRLRLLVRAGRPVATVAFSADGAQALVAGPGRRISVRNAGSGRSVVDLRANAPVTAAAYSGDGKSIVYAAGQDVAVVAVPSGGLLRRLRNPSAVVSVSIAPDGRIAAGGADGSVRHWEPGGRLIRTIRVPRARAAHVSFSPDGSRLVAGTSDGIARVWNAETGRLELTLEGHRDRLTSARFSPDGKAIVTASADHDARVWNADTGARARLLRGHFAVVSDAQFSPDGRWIVTAGPMSAGLWDAHSGQFLLFLRGHRERLTSAAFDPSSRRIVTASVDGTVRTYKCEICGELDALVPLAEKRLSTG
jgi:WD40 repeat protein